MERLPPDRRLERRSRRRTERERPPGRGVVRAGAGPRAAPDRGGFRAIPHFGGAHEGLQALLGRLQRPLPRNGEARLRHALRCGDPRGDQAFLRRADAHPPPLHAFRHGGDLAGPGTARRRRVDHDGPDARTRGRGRTHAGPLRAGPRGRIRRAQHPQQEEPASEGDPRAARNRRRELPRGVRARDPQDGQPLADRDRDGEGSRGSGFPGQDHAVLRAAGRLHRPRGRTTQAGRRPDLLRGIPRERDEEALERAFRAVGAREGRGQRAGQAGRRRGEDRGHPRTARSTRII